MELPINTIVMPIVLLVLLVIVLMDRTLRNQVLINACHLIRLLGTLFADSHLHS